MALPMLRHMEALGILRGEALAQFNKLNNPESQCGKTRPCIVVPSPDDAESAQKPCFRVCLMGTLDKTLPEDLQRVYQEFAIPIYPNLGNPRSHTYHIHTYPEWSEESGWVIPIPMEPKTMKSLTPRARWSRSVENPNGYRLANELFDFFQIICERKTKKFMRSIEVSSHATQFINDLLWPPNPHKKSIQAALDSNPNSNSMFCKNDEQSFRTNQRPRSRICRRAIRQCHSGLFQPPQSITCK